MDATGRLYLDRVLTPDRSLSKTGFAVLIGLIAAVNLMVATVFYVAGAPPVPIFLGLDVLGVWIAFRLSYGQMRRRERVQVSAAEVRVLQETGAASRTIWSSPTAFTRVALEDTGRYGLKVRLRLSDKWTTIGLMLGPKARAELAEAVAEAIRAARRR